MPLVANSSARSLSELLLIAGLFPLRSVGPEPAIKRATGIACFFMGSSNVPFISPVADFKTISDSEKFLKELRELGPAPERRRKRGKAKILFS
jgi:hypothetical protein